MITFPSLRVAWERAANELHVREQQRLCELQLHAFAENVNRAAASMREVNRAITNMRDVSWEASDDVDHTEHVDAGVATLDERLGRDFWLPRVNITTLDVMSQLDCVVCQVTGFSYATGVAALGGPREDNPYERLTWAVARGFALPGYGNYATLTAAWIHRVEALRANAGINSDSVRITV